MLWKIGRPINIDLTFSGSDFLVYSLKSISGFIQKRYEVMSIILKLA